MITSDALQRRLHHRAHRHDHLWRAHGLRSPRDLTVIVATRTVPQDPSYDDFFLPRSTDL